MPASITPPTSGSDLLEQLAEKLDEYKRRLVDKAKPWGGMDPRLAYQRNYKYRKTCHKAAILATVLASSEPVTYQDLKSKAQEKHGKAFDEEQFREAYGIIAVYCGSFPEETVHAGTGLPELAKV